MNKIQVAKESSFTGHKDCVYSIEKARENHQFFSGAGDGMAVLWDIEIPGQGKVIAKVPSSIYALKYFKPEDLLVIGQNYDGIHLVEVGSKKHKGSLKFTDSAIFDIKIFERYIIAGTGNGELVIIDRHDLRIVKKIKVSDKSVRCLDIDPINNILVAGFSDNKIRIFSLVTFMMMQELSGHTNSVFTVKFSPDYKYLLSAGRDAHLKIWDVASGFEVKESIVAHMYAINSIDFSPDGKYFATCSMDKSVKVWDALHFKLLKVIDKARHAGHGTSVNKLAWLDYKNLLISGSDDRTLSIWSINFNA